MKPFLRWAGSKRQILNRLLGFWPGGSVRYIEPFCGSACLFFSVEPCEAILGDLNWELVRTLRAVRDNVDAVIDHVRRLPLGEASYYKIREQDPRELSDTRAAARFIYLNRYCFNGLYRTNLKGRFNVPYGRQKTLTPIGATAIRKASHLLTRARLIHGDFAATLAHAQPGDFVFIDPPYAVDQRRVFSEYVPGSFSATDLARLKKALHHLEENGARFLVTYADSREGRELLGPWKPRRVASRRNIAGFSGDRRKSYELLAASQPGGGP